MSAGLDRMGLLGEVKRTPRYLEPQFEVGSLPVSEGAGMLLLGGGVGMVAAEAVYTEVLLVVVLELEFGRKSFL